MAARKPKSEHKKTGPKGPTKYSQGMGDKLKDYGNGGEGILEACKMLGISKETFYEWGRLYPEFSDAISEFKMNSQIWWEKGGRAGTFGKIAGFNANAYSLQMRNRFPADWRDKQETAQTVRVEAFRWEDDDDGNDPV